ncbi:MAG: M15 family metallopeptidase [Bacilli bacterium]|nr:M15 family metallopeptidase [Bacilli bacterium]
MDYKILVNKDNTLDKSYIPDDLVDALSSYRDGILINKLVLKQFNLMREDAKKLGYNIDIMSGYRDYMYQEAIYNKLLKEKGFAYTFRSIAKPGTSEHQTGLAIDICIYKGDKCYIEHEVEDSEEINWLINNSHKYGFILRYPKNMEDRTGYNYEPWHYRYVGDIAEYLYKNNLLLEDYFSS